MLDVRASDIHLQGVYPTNVDFEGRVRQVWSIHCPQEVLLSELRSAVIGKSSRWGYQRRAIKIIVPLILFHVSSASLFCKLTNSICKYVWDSTSG
ncbi:hypothetical protein RDI58_027751 [Solanum bulbocastanum]|uniref:Uncharacterized protein n=1 Tax=Solanum bulbocastanum TaxID=147425 RepID=A0AAN8SW05_SOLBU